MVSINNMKQEVGGDLITIYFLNKREMTFSEPIHIGFTFFELSNLYMYKT